MIGAICCCPGYRLSQERGITAKWYVVAIIISIAVLAAIFGRIGAFPPQYVPLGLGKITQIVGYPICMGMLIGGLAIALAGVFLLAKWKFDARSAPTTLQDLLHEENAEAFKIQIEQHPEIVENTKDPLHTAITSGRSNMLPILLAQPTVDVNALDDNGNTPLHLAAQLGDLQAAEALIAKSPNLSLINKAGNTPLYAAVENKEKSREVALLILEHSKEEINFQQKRANRTALALAAINGDAILVEAFLINSHTKVNLKDIQGQTPLHLAAKENHPDVVQLLHAYDPTTQHIKNEFSQTPWDEAHEDCKKLF